MSQSDRSYDVGNLDPGRTYAFSVIASVGPGQNDVYERSDIGTESATTSKYCILYSLYIVYI